MKCNVNIGYLLKVKKCDILLLLRNDTFCVTGGDIIITTRVINSCCTLPNIKQIKGKYISLCKIIPKNKDTEFYAHPDMALK